jgi:hypothetical protein
MKIHKAFLLVAFLVSFGFDLAPDHLEYKFKVGDQYAWIQETKQTITQSVMGTEQKTENINSSSFVVKVVEVTPTGAKLETMYTKMKNETKSPMGNNVMDSDGADDKMENKIFKSMVNKPFFVFISSSGNVEKIEGASNLWSGFESLSIDEATKKNVKASLEMMMGESALAASFQSAFVVYPGSKAKQSQPWTVKHEMSSPFAMAVENTWSLESLNKTEGKLLADGKFATTDKDKVTDLPGGLKTKTNLSGQQAIKATVNAVTGWPSTHEILSEIKGTMTLLAGSMVPQDMEIPMEILTETKYTITKK